VRTGAGGADGDEDEVAVRRLARLERLECTNAWDALDGLDVGEVGAGGGGGGGGGGGDDDDDDEYRASDASGGDAEDGEDVEDAGAQRRRPSRAAGKAAAKKLAAVRARKDQAPRRTKLSLVEAVLSEPRDAPGDADWVSAAVPPSRYPAAPACDATGRRARYRDPNTGLRFADRRAHALLEQAEPAWYRALSVAPYWEAVAQIRADRAGR